MPSKGAALFIEIGFQVLFLLKKALEWILHRPKQLVSCRYAHANQSVILVVSVAENQGITSQDDYPHTTVLRFEFPAARLQYRLGS